MKKDLTMLLSSAAKSETIPAQYLQCSTDSRKIGLRV